MGARSCVELGPSLGVTSTREVVTKAQEGDTTAMNAVREVGRRLSDWLSPISSPCSTPPRVVLGGSLSEAGLELLNGVREVVYSRSFPLATQSFRVVTSRSGPYAAILGASAIAVEHYLAEGTSVYASNGGLEADPRLVEAAAGAKG